ncbi:MAG: hypothetical protein M1834_006378 [Cirrosporium novae-zelandiae]|nr:MAG: hypothetical protein M1834_006378 [Cirrosporium novae-zelandiae]
MAEMHQITFVPPPSNSESSIPNQETPVCNQFTCQSSLALQLFSDANGVEGLLPLFTYAITMVDNNISFPGLVGKHVITIEGLGTAKNPHPLQERVAKLHGSQCGFCTPGIIMSLYALIRNAYNPKTQKFHLSENDIELEGHLDGNLCRCTGYKPILQAAKTFVTEDLKGQLLEEPSEPRVEISAEDKSKEDTLYRSESQSDNPVKSTFSCGRPGGCCRDQQSGTLCGSVKDAPPERSSSSTLLSDSGSSSPTSSDSTKVVDSDTSSETHNEAADLNGSTYGKPMKSRENKSKGIEGVKATSALEAPPLKGTDKGVLQFDFRPYSPSTELIFPPALRKFEDIPISYCSSQKIWIRPLSLSQLVAVKAAYPMAKIISGSSEVQIEIRFKNAPYYVLVYIGDVPELAETQVPETEAEIQTLKELVVGANTTLTEVEQICKTLYTKLGQRASPLEALRKQLRYFAGRQIRNVASIAGNIATASPISDISPLLVATKASLVAQNFSGEITLPMTQFFIGYRKTTLPPDSIITRVHIPLPAPGTSELTKAYKQAKRKDDDIAIVTAAMRVKLNANMEVEDISLIYGGMAPTVKRAEFAEGVLIGKLWADQKTLDEGIDALTKDFDLKFGVLGGMATYRKTLAISFFFRFWHEVMTDLNLGKVDIQAATEIHRGISRGMRDNHNPHAQRVVGQQVPHLSALKQNTGQAEYVDDMPPQARELYGALVLSAKAHAKIISVDWTPALAPGLALGYVDRHSIPKEANLWGSAIKDEPFFAENKVFSHGQPIGLVYAETSHKAQAAAKAVNVVYEELPPILTIDEAIEANSFFPHSKELRKGAQLAEMDKIFAGCDRVFTGLTRMGGQEHFYLETNAALCIPLEDDAMEVWSSTQNTMEVQEFVSQVLGVPSNRVNARVKRMGGAFGGKESRACQLAAILAVAAKKENRPVRCMLNRDEDIMTSGQRHPVQSRWKVGVTNKGKLVALDADVYDNGGYSQDMSGSVLDRCITHLENCYQIPNVHIRAHACRTNTVSNTAFRGFGGPQGMWITETIMSTIAEGLDIPIDELRLRNMYKQGDLTPFHQKIDEDWHVPLLIEQIHKEADYEARKVKVDEFNSKNKWRKRGIAMIPTKFGLSFATALHLNQAGAMVRIYGDGSILLNHGGTEMGQGLYTKMCQIAAQELGVPLDSVFTQDTTSYQVANASPTAASSGSDLNGMAIKNACDQLNERLQPYRKKYGSNAPMKTLAHAAYLDRVDLNAHGFWKMPRIGHIWGEYDPAKQNPMYYYFTQGVAISEVELDCLTGDHTVLRTDIKMDIGRSINPAIDYGQIEGAFIQGQGLYTIEESLWTQNGELSTRGPGTYKIPGFSDIPQEFNVTFLQGVSWQHLRSIQSSKGIGEPPLFLGCSVFFALREALRSARKDNGIEEPLVLQSPATAERLRLAVGDPLLKKGTVAEGKDKNFFVSIT